MSENLRPGRQQQDAEADVVVVGSGVAGLCAAIEAATAGARAVVLEAQDWVGGASLMSGAGCCLIGTPLQEANGIKDSVELALSDWAATGGPTADLAWARQYVENSRRDVYEWCEQLGIRWVALTQPEGNSVPRWHQPDGWGREIVRHLLAQARSLGVTVHTGTPVTGLLTEGSAIRGVATSVGRHGERRARSVVICSGGFAANRSMVLEQAPQLRSLPRLLSGSSPHAIGAGHRLLAGAGAAFTCLDHIWVYPNGTPDPCDPRGQRGLGIRGLAGEIWLNAEGQRFHDEGLNGGRSGTAALLSQPGQTCWCVFGATQLDSVLLIDNEYFATPAGPHPEAMARFWAESDYAWRTDGPEQLAAATGLPPGAVRASVDEFNAAIHAGLDRDSRTGRDLRGLHPLEGPLAAIQYFPMAQKTFGGVRTDLDCRVLDESGQPIDGLFAAGEVAGMAGGCINGRAALEGTMFGPCLYSGRVAGIAAADARRLLAANRPSQSASGGTAS